MPDTTIYCRQKKWITKILIHQLNHVIMNNPQNNRDPVCGMTVNPATAKYSHVHQGMTWYFCSPGCQQQFSESPASFLRAKEVIQRTPRRIGREILVSSLIFVVVLALIIMGRGIAKQQTATALGAMVMGTSAGAHQAVDAGQGSVITTATHDPKSATTTFTVSLNSHTVDLTSFNPAKQIRLQEGDQETAPDTTVASGERSQHHQNYRLTFPIPESKVMFVVIRDVAGVNRALPFFQ